MFLFLLIAAGSSSFLLVGGPRQEIPLLFPPSSFCSFSFSSLYLLYRYRQIVVGQDKQEDAFVRSVNVEE